MLWRVALAAVFCLTIDLSSPALAQLVREHDAQGLRSFHGRPSHIRRSFRSDAEAHAVFKHILAVSGLAGMEDRITVRASAETDNAEAFVEKTADKEERLIFYNAVFMQEIARKTKDYWSMVAILAHEVGHHIRLHTVIPGRDHEFELEADYQAGFILRRMGATLDQTQAAFRTVGPEAATPSHPARAQRVQAATLGWTDGAAVQPLPMPGPATAVAPSAAPTPPPTVKQAALPQAQPAREPSSGGAPVLAAAGARQRFSVEMGKSVEITSGSIVLAVREPDLQRNSIGVRIAGRGTRMGVGQEFPLGVYGGGSCRLALLEVSAAAAGFLLKC